VSRTPDAGLLGVGCVGRQIVIRVATAEARAATAVAFAALLEGPRPNPLARLTLRRGPRGYVVGGGHEPDAVDGSLADALRSLRHQVTLHLMAARPDLLWLHAAGAARDGRAVLIAGLGGSGKSTLATCLAARGFSYLGDDVIPLDPETGVLHPFPVTPTVRPDPGRLLPPEAVRALPRAEVRLDPIRIAHAPVPVGLVVFPAYEPGATRTWPWPPAQTALEILRHCLDFARHRERAVRAVCALVSTWPAVGLRFDDADRAAELVARAHADAAGRAAAG